MTKSIKTVDNILSDGIGYISRINSMGNDITIVNTARVSFDKRVDSMGSRDVKLIKYLIENHHWSPFRGVVFQFRVKAPLFVARQWVKHMVASSYVDSQNQFNETSFRYVDASDFDFYIPSRFKHQSKSNKQCSGEDVSNADNYDFGMRYLGACDLALDTYKYLVEHNVSREQARGVLPTSVYTTWIWTVSLQALINFIKLRTGAGAQNEIALYAEALLQLTQPIVPETYKILKEINNEN